MRLAARLARPQTTVRWKLTLLYGGLFLACGAALLAITYTLVAHATTSPDTAFVTRSGPPFAGTANKPPPKGLVVSGTGGVQTFSQSSGTAGHPPKSIQLPNNVARALRSRAGQVAFSAVVHGQRISDLHQLELWSGIALGIMAVISALLGWLVAGRVLRPLRTITAATQQISEENLHERLALGGPRDELGQLADTIDGLLERLEGAFDAQRRFVANASHELRTPLTSARALLEMVLADPDATTETFRRTCRQALEENEQQEQLIEALLALAQGQRGIDRREQVDLAAVTDEVLRAHELEAAAQGLRVDSSLEPVVIDGDRRLITRLVSNLIENAIRHNVQGGRLEARVGRGTLAISNTGPPVPYAEIERLLQPFQRLAEDRVGYRDGIGLGLSIVAAVANAHGAELEIRPGDDGGLRVEVRFTAPRGEPGNELRSAPQAQLPDRSASRWPART
jgi:signal transduction histidine kinase